MNPKIKVVGVGGSGSNTVSRIAKFKMQEIELLAVNTDAQALHFSKADKKILIGKDIKRYLDRVTENFETLIINRGKDTGIVIMSLEEYNSLSATHHELSSKLNEKRLDTAIEKLKTGKSFPKELLEL